MTILAFPEAMNLAETASTPADIKAVLDDIAERLAGANHAIAVDSAYQIVKALHRSIDRLWDALP